MNTDLTNYTKKVINVSFPRRCHEDLLVVKQPGEETPREASTSVDAASAPGETKKPRTSANPQPPKDNRDSELHKQHEEHVGA